MNKVYVLPADEQWICDRFVKEWSEDNADITVSTPQEANVIWLLSDWRWQHVSQNLLKKVPVITSVHHIVPEKFGAQERFEFDVRDTITTVYHVYNERTYDFVKKITTKPIHLIHYWANQKIWHPTGTKQELRKKHGLPPNTFLIGSFQRDTEGAGIPHGIFLPKLEKGPDLFCNFVEQLYEIRDDLHVVLAGWRRQYVLSRLEQMNIPHTYFERPSQEVINELYQTLDLIPVTARQEGGPQSLIECGLLNVPVISRPVGIAEQVLPFTAIADDLIIDATPAIPNVETWKLPDGYKGYRDLIQSL